NSAQPVENTEADAQKTVIKIQAPAEKPAHESIVVKSNTKAPVESAQALPVIGIAADSANKDMSGLIDTGASARTRVLHVMKVSQGVSQGLLIKKVTPDYPQQARQLRIEGSVQLEATIAKDGSVTKLKVLGGHPMLARAASDAVKQWKYKP